MDVDGQNVRQLNSRRVLVNLDARDRGLGHPDPPDCQDLTYIFFPDGHLCFCFLLAVYFYTNYNTNVR